MQQRQPRHLGSGPVLASVLVFAATVALAPRASHAQGQCPTRFQEQTSGLVTDQGTVCQTAVSKKCVFEMALCVNETESSCTPQNLKHKNIHASSLCNGVGKVHVKANGTSSVCGTFAGVTVRTKKHGTKAGSCKISGKAGKAKTKITLLCEPQAGLCATTTTTSTTSTTIPPPCTCSGSGSSATKLAFTTGIGSGSCGAALNSAGGTLTNLACGGLYTGGGGNSVPLPYAVPDMGSSLTRKAACNGMTLTLGPLTSTDTGSNRNCTSAGCLFGPPLPIPNPGSPPTSVCVINTVAQNAIGTADCSTGASAIGLPLTSTLYLDGDLFPNAPGIQVCPVCTKACNTGANNGGPCNGDADCANAGCTGAGVPMPCCTGFQTGTCTAPGSCAGANACHGGPNNGMPCTPAASPISQSFPTTHDCPPPPSSNIGNLPIAFALTTGTTSLTAMGYNANAQCTGLHMPNGCCSASGTGTCVSQNNVFCGFCRDSNGKGTGCFEGDPFPGCPHNNANPQCTGLHVPAGCCSGTGTGTCNCTGLNTPWKCCTGANTGTCDQPTFKACSVGGTSTAACTDGGGAWPDCVQRNPGAFGPARFGAHTITETGSVAGDISDGAGHPSTLVSIFCIPPTFNATVDAAGDLPGPGAVSLPGIAQLQ